MTKPRPDQPGRCPSIDPHDTLQCTRAIHDDDQCRAGGIAWRKGSPRIEWDRERADRLQEDVEEYDATLGRQGDLLTRTVNALRGNPPPLTSWSHHDIPELAAEKVSEIARLTAERDALAAQVARVEKLAEWWRYKGEFGWGAWQLGEGPDPEGYVMDHCASALRAALTDTDADLIERVAEWLHDDENATDRWEDRGESTRRAYRSGSRDLLDALREAGYSVTRDRDAAQRDTEERGESR